MRIDISDEQIVRHLRDCGMVGPIDADFISDYRADIIIIAVIRALMEVGANPNEPIRDEHFAAAPPLAAKHLAREVASW